jgi:hypothetical protein
MPDALPSEKLRQYLLELKPGARALLVSELERAALRGEAPPGASTILEELRGVARQQGGKLPRAGNPQRLFFAVAEPFLVDQAPGRKPPGRIARASLGPIWDWISRDLMPDEAKSYTDGVQKLLAASEKSGAAAVARAFQDLAQQRLTACLASLDGDDRARRRIAGQIGTRHAVDELRELAAMLRARDVLGMIGARLPETISNLGDEHLENIGALLDSPVGRHREILLCALLIVRSRLGSPWQLIRVAIHAAKSDLAARIAETPHAAAVEIVLTDIDQMIAALRSMLKTGDEVADLLKDIHDAARALRTEMDLSADSAWGRQLAAARAETAKLLQAEIDNVPGRVRRLLRPREGREAQGVIDAGDVAAVEAKLTLAAACRNFAGELAISEATRRIHSDLQTYFDIGTQTLIDRLRTTPPAERACRQSQVDAAIRFCGKLFGAEYAGLLTKAADIAAKGEQKAARA